MSSVRAMPIQKIKDYLIVEETESQVKITHVFSHDIRKKVQRNNQRGYVLAKDINGGPTLLRVGRLSNYMVLVH